MLAVVGLAADDAIGVAVGSPHRRVPLAVLKERIAELVRKYGKAVFRKTCNDLMDYAERRMRSEIAAFPDGHYTF